MRPTLTSGENNSQLYNNNRLYEKIKSKNKMFAKEGYWDVVPEIKKVSFPRRGKFQVDLVDGRIIIMPVSTFPCLKKVPVKERSKFITDVSI